MINRNAAVWPVSDTRTNFSAAKDLRTAASTFSDGAWSLFQSCKERPATSSQQTTADDQITNPGRRPIQRASTAGRGAVGDGAHHCCKGQARHGCPSRCYWSSISR